jgi:hypothetical protein
LSWIVTYSSMERCSSFEQYILFRWIYNVTMTCEELKGEKNEIVVCNKYLWKCEKVQLAITTCQLQHVYERLCEFWYWYAK